MHTCLLRVTDMSSRRWRSAFLLTIILSIARQERGFMSFSLPLRHRCRSAVQCIPQGASHPLPYTCLLFCPAALSAARMGTNYAQIKLLLFSNLFQRLNFTFP